MTESRLSGLMELLRARSESNDATLRRFNDAFYRSNPPHYDTELAESDGMVQGEQRTIAFVLKYLAGDDCGLGECAQAHLERAVQREDEE